MDLTRRMFTLPLAVLAVIAAVLAMPPVAPADTAAPAEATESASETASLLQRVGVIGASATCGFGVEIDITGPHGPTTAPADMALVVAAMLPENSRVDQHGSLFFFTRPGSVGPNMIEQAIMHESTLVIGIDYLFWYGYGNSKADGQPITDEAQRLELLEAGLKQLDRLECPVVVGDFPDMSAAVGKMLGFSQLPRPDTLKKLNTRLHAWADDKPNVVVVPLSVLVSSMQRGEEVRIGEQVWAADDVVNVIQDDQLHPTVQGLVLMAEQAMHELLTANPNLDRTQFTVDRETVLTNVRTLIETRARELVEKMQQRQAEHGEPHAHPHRH